MKPLKWEEIKLESASRLWGDGVVVILRAFIEKEKYENSTEELCLKNEESVRL